MENRTIAETIAEIEAALDRIEAMVAELRGNVAEPKQDAAQESAEAQEEELREDVKASARALRRAKMRDCAEHARAAMVALDEIEGALDGSTQDFLENSISMSSDEAAFECGRRLQRGIGEARLALRGLEACFGAADLGSLSLGENPSEERLLHRVSVAAAFFRELWRDLREGNPRNETEVSYHIAFSKEAVNAA